jgi:hypothetical protein
MTTPSENPTLTAEAPAASLWILGPWRDLLLFVCTPLLIVPAMLGLQSVIAIVALNKWVMAFGAMGHHLPGMMRAYGDRALFRRFKTRLIVSPLVLGGACILYSVKGWHGMVFVAFAWGVWHGLMQTHGFLRIYDSKRKSFARRTAWLDQFMCLAWFLGGVVWSDSRVDNIANMIMQSGGPLLTIEQVDFVRTSALVVMVAVTTLFLVNALMQTTRGVPPSPVKLLLLTTSILFWWYSCIAVENILLGIILFEIFHDVQYLAIVWIFNRRRVESDPGVGSFSRFLFRRSYGLMALYLAMVLAYGAIGPWAEAGVESEVTKRVFAGVVTFSALLHFYFDGFIWKVRSKSTRQGLGLEKGTARLAGGASVPTTLGVKHAAKWVFFLVPAIGLAVAESTTEVDEVVRTQALTVLSPNYPLAWYRLGMASKKASELQKAAHAFQREHELDPADLGARMRSSRTHIQLAEKLLREGRSEEARSYFAKALDLEPQVARLFAQEGLVFMNRGEIDKARHSFECSLMINHRQPVVHLNLALVLSRQGKFSRALEHANIGVKGRPNDVKAQQVLEHVQAESRK